MHIEFIKLPESYFRQQESERIKLTAYLLMRKLEKKVYYYSVVDIGKKLGIPGHVPKKEETRHGLPFLKVR